MRKQLFILLLLFCSAFLLQAKHGMHPKSQIEFVKKQIKSKNEPYYTGYLQLLHYADSILPLSENALADFAVPGYYVDPEGHRTNSKALQNDAFGAYCSALAYTLSGKEEYGLKACYFLDAWASKNKRYSEADGPLVMAYSGSALLMAAELMSDHKLWKKENQEAFANWVTTVYQKATNEIRTRKNNWADWGRLGSLLGASFLNDSAEVSENVRLVKSDLFDKISPDGSMPEEVKRGNNGIWYTYFSLAPMTASCWLIYNLTGENLFEQEKEGISIRKALDYLLYYHQHPGEWKWAEKQNIAKDLSWPQNLFEAMSGIYSDKDYADYGKTKRPIIYPVHHFAWSFPTLMPLRLDYKSQE